MITRLSLQIGDASLAALAGQAQLEHLCLDGCRRVTDEGLQHLSGNGSFQHFQAFETLMKNQCKHAQLTQHIDHGG